MGNEQVTDANVDCDNVFDVQDARASCGSEQVNGANLDLDIQGATTSHKYVRTKRLTLHYFDARPDFEEHGVCVLLHGFPDCWLCWRHQVPALVKAGYRVVCPDLPGYGRSDKPEGIDAYAEELVAGDIIDLLEAIVSENSRSDKRVDLLAAHDWGGFVAWGTCARRPNLVKRLCTVNIPHLASCFEAWRELPEQIFKSWYLSFFQMPMVPDTIMTLGLPKTIMHAAVLLRKDEVWPELELYEKEAWLPECMTPMLNYYRALGGGLWSGGPAACGYVDLPVRILWGTGDLYIEEQLQMPPPDIVPNAKVHPLPGAGHWPMLDVPLDVAAALLDFLEEDA